MNANSSADSRLNVSVNLNSVGQAIKNESENEVKDSNNGSKLYACIFCLRKKMKTGKNLKTMYTALPVHFTKKTCKQN